MYVPSEPIMAFTNWRAGSEPGELIVPETTPPTTPPTTPGLTPGVDRAGAGRPVPGPPPPRPPPPPRGLTPGFDGAGAGRPPMGLKLTFPFDTGAPLFV